VALDPAQKAAAGRVLELIQMRLLSEALYVAASLGVADSLADGPKTAEALAESSGADPVYLKRVLRALSQAGMFREEADGFALAPMATFLQRGVEGSLHSAALLFGGEHASRLVGLLLDCVKRGESAVHMEFGGEWTNWVQRNPEHAQLFNGVMTSYATLAMSGVLDAYDFSYASQLVDVGGGHGRVIADILRRYPSMRGVLFDMPHAFAGGQATLANAGLSERCQVVSGDFFVSVPAGADAYLLSRVLHDWTDSDAVRLLANIRSAIVPYGRLIVLEAMLGQEGKGMYPVLSDLNMMVRTGGCERTEAEYRAIFRAAGFELTRAVPTTSPSGTAVIEGRPIAR